jgi:hypothetical protein
MRTVAGRTSKKCLLSRTLTPRQLDKSSVPRFGHASMISNKPSPVHRTWLSIDPKTEKKQSVLVNLVPTTSKDFKFGQQAINEAASSSTLVLFNTRNSRLDGPESSSRGNSPARSLERKAGIPAKFSFCSFVSHPDHTHLGETNLAPPAHETDEIRHRVF